MQVRIVVTLIALALGACASREPLTDVPLVWRPTSSETVGTVKGTSLRIRFEPFKNESNQPRLIAENREEATVLPVTTRDEVGAFVSTEMRHLFDVAGLTTVSGNGDVIVSGEVKRFFVTETGTYEGSVIVHVTLRDPTGKVLWGGTATGSATRFGRSYSQENYYEVLSDSVIDATHSLLHNADFVQTLVRK
jgi:hypothetical protein